MSGNWTNTIQPNLGEGRYNAMPPTVAGGALAELQVDDAAALRVVVVGTEYGAPTAYAVASAWPAQMAALALVTISGAPGTGTMPAGAAWIVVNSTASGVMISGHSVPAHRAELLRTDAGGAVTATSICVVG